MNRNLMIISLSIFMISVVGIAVVLKIKNTRKSGN